MRRGTLWGVAVVTTAVAGVVVVRAVDTEALGRAATAVRAGPGGAAVALAAFGTAFVLRARAWQRALPGLGFGHALAGIHVALGANHVLPLRLGEPFRVLSVVRRAGVAPGPAAASTVALRAADVTAVLALAWLLGPAAVWATFGWWAVAATVVAGVAVAVGVRWARHVALPAVDAWTVVLTVVAWLAESVVVWQSARWVGVDLDPAQAVLVATVSVAAQIVAVAPSGFGTYEAAGVAVYATLGVDPGTALAAAVVAHAVKTVYSLVAGAVAVVVPGPGMAGRLRLPAERPARPSRRARSGSAQAGNRVLVFLPARDEAATVADVVALAPGEIGGHAVTVVVVDDGSTDETAVRAVAAGARVVPCRGRGLGAAVRTGLALAVEEGYDAVAFCDADGEYDPAEIDRLVSPVLDGTADYVVGSRFAGAPRRMRSHRWLGNVLLTRALACVARRPISDGQSGFRALSAAAARDAGIIHDFNYAQVLTLDLLARGYAYAEVPISYSHRTTGRSFVRLAPYLRRVVPAVHRQVNAPTSAPEPFAQRPPTPRSVFDDVGAEPGPGG